MVLFDSVLTLYHILWHLSRVFLKKYALFLCIAANRGKIEVQTYRKGDELMLNELENRTFGDRLRQLRSERNFNQASFGELLGEIMGTKRVSSSAIGAYERNEREPTYELLKAIANYFNVSLDYLLCNSDEKLRVDEFVKQDTYELQELLSKYKITLNGSELSPPQKQRLMDIAATLLLSQN